MNSTDAFVINSDEENNKDDYDEPTAESHDDSNSGSYNTSNHFQSERNNCLYCLSNQEIQRLD